MAISDGALKTCVVGCKRGLAVGRRVQHLQDYRLAAFCDLDRELAQKAAEELEGTAYVDYDGMLAAEKPDVVFVATNTQPRAMLTVKAADAGVPGIIAEKPMAMSMGEAKAMVEACDRAAAKLIVTHQRRMGSDMLQARQLIEEGALGDVYLVRASCQGDVLTDGTHAVDSTRALVGDEPVEWVLGQAFRVTPGPNGETRPGFEGHTGFRYGHAVESGTMAILQFESGLRAEVFTGRACVPGRAYQDYEVFGSKGRLWRPGDRAGLRIWTEQTPHWQDVDIRPENEREEAMVEAWMQFARMLREDAEHPLDGHNALRDHELVMAILESARTSQRIELPLEQEEYPLELMMAEGRA